MNKLLGLFRYISVIKNNRDMLLKKHNLRINWLYQLYTIISLPPERHKNAIEFGVNGYPYLNEEVERYMKSLDVTLMETGLLELAGIQEMTKIDDLNVKVVITYAYLNVEKTFRNAIIFGILLLISSAVILFKTL